MSDINIKRYQDITHFLSETKLILEEQEVINTFVIISALDIQSKAMPPTFYCSAAWRGSQLVMAMVCSEGDFLYTSTVNDNAVISIMVDDFLKSAIDFKGIHAYQLVLDTLRSDIESKSLYKFERENKVWSCVIKRKDFKWPPQLKERSKGGSLRLATMEEDLPLIEKWAGAFLADLSKEHHMQSIDVSAVSRASVSSNGAYLWCAPDGEPVSMAWKRRPLSKGCSMAYVYTPREYRGRGLGGIVVLALTEHLLRSYEYVTLLVSGERDPNDNLYSRLGYKCIGEAGRLERLN